MQFDSRKVRPKSFHLEPRIKSMVVTKMRPFCSFMIALVLLAGTLSCQSMTPEGNISINGLYFSDIGCTKCDSSLDLTGITPSIHAGLFEFSLENDQNKPEDTETIKNSNIFNHPLSEIDYYNISQTEISGWPAIVGVVTHKGVSGDNTDAIGFIYAGNMTIGFSSQAFGLNELPGFLQRIKITLGDMRNMSWESGDSYWPKVIPNELSKNGLHIFPGQLSDSGIGCTRWLGNELSLFCAQPDLTITVLPDYYGKDTEDDINKLTRLTTNGISDLSITYFNITETKLSGWPAVVAILNSTERYASGVSDPPRIRVNAIIHIKNLTILAETGAVWEKVLGESIAPGSGGEVIPGIQPEEIYKKLQSIRITIEPGSEQMWTA